MLNRSFIADRLESISEAERYFLVFSGRMSIDGGISVVVGRVFINCSP